MGWQKDMFAPARLSVGGSLPPCPPPPPASAATEGGEGGGATRARPAAGAARRELFSNSVTSLTHLPVLKTMNHNLATPNPT